MCPKGVPARWFRISDTLAVNTHKLFPTNGMQVYACPFGRGKIEFAWFFQSSVVF